MSDEKNYEPLSADAKPSVGDKAASDFYISLPRSKRFVRYILKGEVWDERKEEMLKKHSDQQLYKVSKNGTPQAAQKTKTPEEELNSSTEANTGEEAVQSAESSSDEVKKVAGSEAEDAEEKYVTGLTEEEKEEVKRFNAEVTENLKEIFRFMADPSIDDPKPTISGLEKISDQILKQVAPDVDNLRTVLLKNSKYLYVMTEAAAITSLSVFTAMANGFSSRKIFRDLSMAILLMDAPLSDMDEEIVEKYYRDRSSLSPEELALFKQHPKKAANTARERMKSVPDSVLQLIANHHELHNGKGYPNGIRSEALPTVIRSLALAVDLYEIMKREHLNGKDIEIMEALVELNNPEIDPHEKRHNRRLITDTITFIKKPAN